MFETLYAHVVQAALVEQVDDQLQFVHALEVGHFGLIAGLDQRFEAGLDQLADAAAEHDLLAEQVGFGLFGERGLDDAAAGAADALGVGQADLAASRRPPLSPTAIRQGTPPPFSNSLRTRWPGPLGATSMRVDARRRVDLAEVDVEAVRAHQDVARLQIVRA